MECAANEECSSAKCVEGYCSECSTPFSNDECDEGYLCTNKDVGEMQSPESESMDPHNPGYTCRIRQGLLQPCFGYDVNCATDVCSSSNKCEECEVDDDCDDTHWCFETIYGYRQCKLKTANGVECNADNECVSGECVDFEGTSYCTECTSTADCETEGEECQTISGKNALYCVKFCTNSTCDAATANAGIIPLNNNEDAGAEDSGMLYGDSTGNVSPMGFFEDALDIVLGAAGLDVILQTGVSGSAIVDKASSSGVQACEELDFITSNNLLLFGYHDNDDDVGICAAFSTSSQTYALAHRNLIPPIKVLEVFEMTPRAFGFSLTKQLQETSIIELWDGATSEYRDLPGHLKIAGDVGFNVGIGTKASVELTVDTDLILDLDPADDGVGITDALSVSLAHFRDVHCSLSLFASSHVLTF